MRTYKIQQYSAAASTVAQRCFLVQFTSGEITMARPKGKKVAARLSVGLSEPQHEALTALAEENEATVAWLVRRAVAEFLERHRARPREPLRTHGAPIKSKRTA